jgi:hypothetical protein
MSRLKKKSVQKKAIITALHHLTFTEALAFYGSLAILMRLGLVAQSVEQRIENPCVGGSIPPRATKKIKGLASAKPFCHFWGRMLAIMPGSQPSSSPKRNVLPDLRSVFGNCDVLFVNPGRSACPAVSGAASHYGDLRSPALDRLDSYRQGCSKAEMAHAALGQPLCAVYGYLCVSPMEMNESDAAPPEPLYTGIFYINSRQ